MELLLRRHEPSPSPGAVDVALAVALGWSLLGRFGYYYKGGPDNASSASELVAKLGVPTPIRGQWRKEIMAKNANSLGTNQFLAIDISVQRTSCVRKRNGAPNYLTGWKDNRCNRDATSLLPDTFVHVGSYLHARDVTSLACVDRDARELVDGVSVMRALSHLHPNGERTAGIEACSDSTSALLWKALWYRDYGDALLKWNIGRDSIRRSIEGGRTDDTRSTGMQQQAVASMLARALDKETLSNEASSSDCCPMKSLYFAFSAGYHVDYLVAGRNTSDQCLLGIHGHIFDFTPFADYHPGLSGPILAECGRDATSFFEDVRHSIGARLIASRLCVLVDKSRLFSKDLQASKIDSRNISSERGKGSCCDIQEMGLFVPSSLPDTSSVINLSNTRPPSKSNNIGGLILNRVLPSRMVRERKQVPILVNYRAGMEDGRRIAERRAADLVKRLRRHFLWSSYLPQHLLPWVSIDRGNSNENDGQGTFDLHAYNFQRRGAGITAVSWSRKLTPAGEIRVYYDPFQRRWRGWYNTVDKASGDLQPIYCELEPSEFCEPARKI